MKYQVRFKETRYGSVMSHARSPEKTTLRDYMKRHPPKKERQREYE